MLDSVIGVNKKNYPETLLEECKYEIKKNKMQNLINYLFYHNLQVSIAKWLRQETTDTWDF